MVDIIKVASETYGIDKVAELVPLDRFWGTVTQAYGYGDKDTQAKSKKQRTKDENIKKLQALQEMAQSFTQLANPNVQWQNQAGGSEPQAQAPALWGAMQWL